MIFSLIQDFADVLAATPPAHPRRRILALLDEAIRRDVHFIDRHPTTLFQCLWNSCWWYDCPEAAKHYEEPADISSAGPPPWAEPVAAPLLETWRKIKEQRTPDFVWLRSHRPPPVPLGMGLAGIFPGAFCVAFSPDGQRLLTGGHGVQIWDIATSAELLRLRDPTAFGRSVAYSPDGRLFITADDKMARVWDAETGAEVLRLPHDDKVQNVAFAPTGRAVLTASQTGARAWDLEGHLLRTLNEPKASMECAALSSDGRLVATGHWDCTVRVWNLVSGEQVRCLRGHTDTVVSVAFSRAGRKIVSGATDNTIRVWDAARGTEIILRPDNPQIDDVVAAIAISPEGRFIASGSQDRTPLRVWDATTGALLRCLRGHGTTVTGLAFSPRGDLLASAAGDSVRLWDARTAHEPRQLQGHQAIYLAEIAFSPDGNRFVSTLHDMHVWDVVSGASIWCHRKVDESVELATFSPNGSRVVAVTIAIERYVDEKGRNGHRWNPVDGTVRLWDAATGAELGSFRLPKQRASALALSPDARRVAVALSDHTVRIWDVATGAELHCLSGHEGLIEAVAFSPDGQRVASGARDRTARTWDANSGTQLQYLGGHEYGVSAIAFTPDGQRLLIGWVGSSNYQIWDLASCSLVGEVVGVNNIAAAAAGALARWRRSSDELGGMIEESKTGRTAAWLPRLKLDQVNCSGRTWAGYENDYVVLATLEGGPEIEQAEGGLSL